MSLTVVKRPHDLGNPWFDTQNNLTVTNSAGDALVTETTHGLSTGNNVYILSDVSTYNGIWVVTVVDPNTYTIHEYSTAAAVSYVVDATGTSQHIGSTPGSELLPVHLPMVYKIQSNLWPVNGADTARTVSSFANYNGYTALSLSGTLHTGSTVLESVTIVGTSSLDGIYRIINWFSASSIVIDLAYSASNSFSGGTVQYYYMNYHARVRVYGGISSGFSTLKPMELLAELRCLPDSTGLITVNINEIVKKKIDILANNLISPTLPFNIEANCDFYISVAESYDDSDGYTVSEHVSSYTDDSAAIAVNAKLPFKTVGVGLWPYFQLTSGLTTLHYQKFATLFTAPVMTPGKYFDISFFVRSVSNRTIKREVYKDGVKVDEFNDTVVITHRGLHRYSFEQSGHTEDRIDLTILLGGSSLVLSETITITVDNECSDSSVYITWLNYLGGFDYWNFTAKKTSSINVLESRTQVKNIFTGWPNSYGETADTIRQNTFKSAQNSIRVESGNLTVEQVDGIKWLFSSPLVQIVDSASDKRTIIVDTNSVVLYNTQDNIFTVAFDASYTDDIPSQSL